jgi:hypothetical protein
MGHDRLEAQVLYRRRGALHRPLSARARAPGLPRPPARGNHIQSTGRTNSNCFTVYRSRCMTEYYRALSEGEGPQLWEPRSFSQTNWVCYGHTSTSRKVRGAGTRLLPVAFFRFRRAQASIMPIAGAQSCAASAAVPGWPSALNPSCKTTFP